ncbi:hypothetical protein [Porphyromonas sp. COT-108 OH2963]|nr:hypothetical protein [Porphyromonas sp. COT-108 OH2963]
MLHVCKISPLKVEEFDEKSNIGVLSNSSVSEQVTTAYALFSCVRACM